MFNRHAHKWLAAALLAAGAITSGANAAAIDFSNPADGTLSGSATVNGSVLQLTTATTWQDGFYTVANPSAAPISSFSASFDLLIGGGTAADGFSFNLGANNFKTVDANPIGPDYTHAETGVQTGLAVSFDTYDNTAVGQGPDIPYQISVYYDGAVIASSGGRTLRTDSYVPVSITLDSSGDLTVTHDNGIDNTDVFTDLPIPGFTPQAGWQFILGARTGTYDDNQFVQDLDVTTNAPTVPLPRAASSGLAVLLGLAAVCVIRRHSARRAHGTPA